MKSIAIAALLGAVSAVTLRDAPPAFDAPPFNQKDPAAAGFLQLETKTKTHCQHAGVTGVDCVPNDMLFATGMNGDEDLGQDITMKGEKFHYNQWNPVVVKTKPGDLPVCHGTNGPVGVNCQAAPCDGTNGPKDGESGTPCIMDQPKSIPKYSTEPTAGQPYADTGNLPVKGITFKSLAEPVANATTFAEPVANATAFAEPVANATAFAEPAANVTTFAEPANATSLLQIQDPERVDYLDPKIARVHTTFYNKH